VDVIHMKGALVGLRLHGRLDARAVSDIDVLLRREADVENAEACLLACGYERASRLFIGHGLTRRFTYQLEYWKGDVPVELHWSLQRDPSLQFEPEEIWRRGEMVEVEGRTYRALSAEDTAVAYAVSVPVDLRLGKLTLRTLLEVYLLLRGMPEGLDWQAWLERREREGTRRVCAAVLSAAVGLLGRDARLDEVSRVLSPHLRAADHDIVSRALSAPGASVSWRRRIGALRLLDGSLPSVAAWWVVSLPARLLAHRGQPRPRAAT
jgi:hypothetical protein